MAEKTADEERIEELRSQVESLQLKLHQLHATDTNTLRRGIVTVAQHVDALKHEATRLERLADELEPELYPPEYIAEELSKAAVVSGAVYGLFKLVKTITPLPPKATSWIRGSLVAVTAIVVTWRFAASSIGRFAASLLGHKRRRKALLKEVAEIQHRIDILHALTHSMPGVPAALQQQPQGEPCVAGDSAAAAAEARESSPAAEQREAQFVVVDLPRVESGGFVLTSPTASSPTPELAAAQQSAAAVAAATATLAVAATAAAAAPQQLPSTLPVSQASHAHQQGSQLQQQQLGVVVPAAMAAVAAATQAVGSTASALQAAAAAAASQQQQQAMAATSASSSARSSLDLQQQQQQQRQQLRSAFSPPSMVMSGWGGVVMQQEHRAHQHLQRDASPTSAAAAAAAGDARHTSSDLGGQGEWVEQPIEAGDNDTAGNTGRQQQQGQGSPASSSSDEGVLLERE